MIFKNNEKTAWLKFWHYFFENTQIFLATLVTFVRITTTKSTTPSSFLTSRTSASEFAIFHKKNADGHEEEENNQNCY